MAMSSEKKARLRKALEDLVDAHDLPEDITTSHAWQMVNQSIDLLEARPTDTDKAHVNARNGEEHVTIAKALTDVVFEEGIKLPLHVAWDRCDPDDDRSGPTIDRMQPILMPDGSVVMATLSMAAVSREMALDIMGGVRDLVQKFGEHSDQPSLAEIAVKRMDELVSQGMPVLEAADIAATEAIDALKERNGDK